MFIFKQRYRVERGYMMLNERQKQFVELYSNKEELKLNHVLIAEQLGVSTKTIQRMLKDPEIIKEINKACASRLDRMLPAVVHNTEKMLNSSSSNDRVKGQESFFKLQEKLTRQSEATLLEREQELTHKLVSDTWELLGDILGVELFLGVLVDLFKSQIIERGYSNKINIVELEKFCREHEIG